MYRSPLDVLRLYVSLFRDVPPLSRSLYVPGAILLLGYPLLRVMFGPEVQAEAFATAFLLALAVRIGIGFEGMVRRMLTRYSAPHAALLAIGFAGLPLLILAQADDPLWCQRMQSVFYLVIGGIFLLDTVKGRTAVARSFWPDAEMRAHLPSLTRMMVLYNASFLVLNETVIRAVDATWWLLFWAVLPVLGQAVLRALVLTIINLNDDGHAA